MIHGTSSPSGRKKDVKATPEAVAALSRVATIPAPSEPALPVLRLAIAVAAIFAFGTLGPFIAAAAR